jgi:hypothetical protein
MLRRGDDVPGRSVDDEDAAFRGGLHVDVVEADSRPADDAELLSGGQELTVHLRGRAHDEGIVVADRREKRFPGKVRADVRGKAFLRKNGEARPGERLGDENSRCAHAALPAFDRMEAMASSCAFR